MHRSARWGPQVTVLLAALLGAAACGQAAKVGGDTAIDERIVFASDRDLVDVGLPHAAEIYTMSPDGGEAIRLTDNAVFDGNPDWSPDGSRIAFTSLRGGDLDIWLMSADGSDVVPLTDNEVYDGAADWSPDGSLVVFDSLDAAGVLQVYTIDSASSGSPVQLTQGEANGKPVWSPDGRRIAYISVPGGNQEVSLMAADGSGQLNLTNGPAVDVLPAWSPDGSTIAFVSDRDGDWEIYLMATDGANVRRLTFDPGEDSNPSWSADGTQILFTSDRDGDVDVYAMAADGSNVRDLTRNDAWDWVPDWSPVARAM